MKKLLPVIVLLLSAIASMSQTVPTKVIDDFKNNTLKVTPGISVEHLNFMVDTFTIERRWEIGMEQPGDMVKPTEKALDEYDKLLNKIYKQLLAKCTPTQKPLLIAAEKAWVIFKDAEFKFWVDYNAEYIGMGNSALLMRMSEFMTLTKERIVSLQGYLEGE